MAAKKDFPSKKYINLAAKEKGEFNPKILIPVIALLLVLAVVIGKFAIVDRFAKVTAAQNELSDYQIRLLAASTQIQNYDAVLEEFQKYSVDWMDDEEKNLIHRTDMIDLIDEDILKYAEASNIVIAENTIEANLVGVNLSETSRIIERLNAREDVKDVQVYSAATDADYGDQLVVSLIVTMKSKEEGGAE